MGKVPGTLKRILMGIDLQGDSGGDYAPYAPYQKAPEDGSPNIATSLTYDGWQAPTLDIDIPCEFVPSTTPGHGHLYIDKPMSYDDYVYLVEALVHVGIVEQGVLYSLKQRGFTGVRLPWIKKPEPEKVSWLKESW